MDKKELMKELDEAFDKTRKELGFKAIFDEIEEGFFIRDAILSSGFVSDRFNRQLCIRMVETYYSWVGQFQAWLTPGIGGSIVNHNEVKSFNDEDREIIKELVEKAMYFLRADKVNGIKRDMKSQGELIDEMVNSKKDFFDKLVLLLEKAKEGWNKKD